MRHKPPNNVGNYYSVKYQNNLSDKFTRILNKITNNVIITFKTVLH